MNFKTSILISLLILVAFTVFSFIRPGGETKLSDSYIPPAFGAVVHKPDSEKKQPSAGFTDNGRSSGQSFQGLEEDSLFVRELRSKPSARAYLEYGYVSPEVLKRDGVVRGTARLRRPDGRKADAVIVDYKGQLYDAEVGFPCYLCADSLSKLGLRVPYF